MARFFMGGETQERMDLGLTRALVLLSFAAHLTLSLLAGIRRRRDSGVRRSLVWFAYYVTEIITPIALTKVFIDTTSMDSEQQLKELVAYREQQMFAFWAPSLLLHLGRPDNITSYALENKGLSPTQIAGPIVAIGGAIYGSYKQGFMRGDGALRAAFFIMIFFGSYKYVERAVALHRASFANIRRSNEKKNVWRCGKQEKQDKDDALLDAHGLLGVTMGAFAEYKVKTEYRFMPAPGGYSRRLYFGWKHVYKVMEMEASLMYDMLYTKASVIHTWGGYIIRVLSPLATCTALYLFHSKEGKAMVNADLVVTYILLVGTLVLDVGWLLRALGSTWTYAFLVDIDDKEGSKGRHRWLKKAGRRACRAGRQSWYLLRLLLVSLDLARLSLRSGPSGHRLLPGVGQCNLLHECSTLPPPRGRLEKMFFFCARPGKRKMDVKKQLLETYLKLDSDSQTIIERHSLSKLDDYMRSDAKNFSFERNLIALHVATDIFLLCKHGSPGIETEESARYKKQIRALSDYMMSLLAQRQHMVLPPGDEASDYKKARDDLKVIWHGRQFSGLQATREAELAIILLEMNKTPQDIKQKASLLLERNDTLALGADWALKLLHVLEPETYSGQDPIPAGIRSRVQSVRGLGDFILVFNGDAQKIIERCRNRDRERSNHEEPREVLGYMLRLILVSWIRLLTFTSNQCSRESHAKQLSRGGELLTIVWLLNQHRENGISIESLWIL